MYPIPARLRPLAAFVGMAVLSTPLTWIATSAHAGGFALVEHGASGLGNAYAGAAAVSADPSTVWFNPAGMSEIDGREMSAALHLLTSSTEWTDEGTSLGAVFGGAPVSGPDTADPGTTSPLPNFYYVAPINEQWNYGLSIGVPFGSSTDYDKDWKGRYTTTGSGINVIDINPSVSFKVSDKIRLGFGISLQQLTANLRSRVDSGAVCLGLVATASPSFGEADCVNVGLVPGNQVNDSAVKISGDSTSVGFNMGALFVPKEGMKIGVAYRHSVDHTLDGDADFTVNGFLRGLLDGNTAPSSAVTTRLLTDTSVEAEVQLPSTFSISGAFQVNDQFELLTDLTWTGWSAFEELRVVYVEGTQTDTVSKQEWEDVFRVSAGLNYTHNEKVTLRTGVAFDEEAIPNAQLRTARIPGNDRTWLSFGMGYQVNQNFSFDLGYAHLFLDETPIDNPDAENQGRNTWVRGEFDSSVNIFSAQINWDFD